MLRVTDPTDVPEGVDPDEHELEYELGTAVAFDVSDESSYGGIVVGVNEHGRPIVYYVGPSVGGMAIEPCFRTTDWEALTPLGDDVTEQNQHLYEEIL